MPRRARNIDLLPEQAARLREAREQRGFANAAAAALYFGWNESTYYQHERGERGLTRAAERYARAFRVSAGYLLTGDVTYEPSRIGVYGRIGAGAVVTLDRDEEEVGRGASFRLPDAESSWGFVVEGDSMRPRFYPGELVVFSRTAALPGQLVGQYCMVQLLETGDRFVKVLRKGRGANLWRLESHNADPIEDVALLGAFAWEATFPARDGRQTVVAELPLKRVRAR